jgi:cystathionine beta-lyase
VCEENQGGLVQPPVYNPYIDGCKKNRAFTPRSSSIANANGYYCIDYDDFEKALDQATRLFVLCNPTTRRVGCFAKMN